MHSLKALVAIVLFVICGYTMASPFLAFFDILTPRDGFASLIIGAILMSLLSSLYSFLEE